MKATTYLEMYKKHFDLKSNYAVAKRLKVSEQTVAKWYHGKGSFSDSAAIKMALELGLDAKVVVADIHAEREKDPEVKKLWVQIAHSLQQATAAAFVLVMLGIPTHSAEASTLNASYSSCLSVYTLYELKKMLKNAFLLRLCSFLRNISLAHFLLNRSFCTEWETIECH